MKSGLFSRLRACLVEPDVDCKLETVSALAADMAAGRVDLQDANAALESIDEPGRPVRPQLVAPRDVGRRGVGSREGHGALLHALAHIEFNAINLALDSAWRYRGLTAEFHRDWLGVAAEEAMHFRLLRAHLRALGFQYGDFTAHDGLWEMAVKTAHDPLVRMALVPRLLEARGLDATPLIVEKLRGIGDTAAIGILDVVLRDEVGHVALGDRWFRYFCAQRALDPESTYRALIEQFSAPRVIRPVNRQARLAAGFSTAEIDALESDAR